jgi:putative transposase
MAYWRMYYHIIWTTKDRMPFVTPEIEAVVHQSIAAKLQAEGGRIYAINGMEDHVHLIAAIPPSKQVSLVIKAMKGSTSHLIHKERGLPLKWQPGYGIFTVGKQGLQIAIDYVKCQKEHHRDGTIIKSLEYATADEDGPPPE